MKATKKSLLSSVLALTLCFAMLLGMTYAWFTDSAVSKDNKVQAGTLDVQLHKWTSADASEEITEEDAPLFTEATIWEPGRTEIVYLSIKNNGNLDLQYRVALKATETSDHDMREVMSYAITPDAKFGEVTSWLGQGETEKTMSLDEDVTVAADSVALEAGAEHFFALSVHMDEEAGNVYMADYIQFDIRVIATQLASEEDGFGNDQYDADAGALLEYAPVSSAAALANAIEDGETNILLTDDIVVADDFAIDDNVTINGAGYTLTRANGTSLMSLARTGAAEPYTGVMFDIDEGKTLTLENIVVDGGAIWTGDVNETLGRGTVNAGVTATGALVNVGKNATLVLGEGAVLQNNCGANAVNLGTRTGGKLIVNGGEIINNYSAAGAIWGGGEIVLNSGKISYNHGGIGGAIRVVTNIGTVLTMNGGEMNHNYSDGVGGAIWAGSSSSNNVYVLNGGEMAYNYSPETGGAIYAGYGETVKIGGDFKMHDNGCAAEIGSAIRFHTAAKLQMTGGEIYNHADNAFFLNNNTASITGGKYVGNFTYSGGVGLTLGEAEIDGVINYNLATNHNTAYLAKDFGSFEFTVNESASNFAQFNFKPAADYTYTEGDEEKLVCLNEGYSTYWDAASSTFKLQAK